MVSPDIPLRYEVVEAILGMLEVLPEDATEDEAAAVMEARSAMTEAMREGAARSAHPRLFTHDPAVADLDAHRRERRPA